jgi:cytochrome b561
MTDSSGRPAAGRYGRVARAVHWLVAAFAVVVVALGWASVAAARNSPAHNTLLLLHRSVGLTILGFMALRGLWRGWHPPPPLSSGLARIQTGLARLTHFGLYLIFLAMPLAGYLNAAAAGHAVNLFGLVAIPPLLPVEPRLSQWAIAVHLVGQYALYLLVVLHVAGALYHGVVRRDGVLDRMLPRRHPSADGAA